MITKLLLSEIISDQSVASRGKVWTKRDIQIPADTKRIIIVSGIRRCGKSTLIRQKLLNKKAIYLNFEDPRLIEFTVSDFSQLEKIATEAGIKRLLLDEIQNIDSWELFARSAIEKGFHIYITGSNASMLSRELGTKLTGRYKQIELFPFSYKEFLSYHDLERSSESFDIYFNTGGFPEHLEEKDDNYLRTLLRDIITRDIAVRRNITNENQLIRLAVHLLSNIGKEFSYNSISKILEIKSVRTVIDYCDYLNESYITDFIPQYSTSIKKQLVNPRKSYCIDPGLARANSISFSKDYGRRLENFVYNKLRRDNREIYYYRSAGAECDFLVKQNEQIILAVQVCWEVNYENMKREINGIKSALAETGAREGYVITYNQEDNLEGIKLIPAWKWI
ncbi:MAG TPA: ATP-binding protein [Bacteroidales bacterium]|nr:ATP-binding protein [Bacteroidales bacterium]